MSIRQNRVIIPRFSDQTSEEKYFMPRFTKILKGESIEWVNLDIFPHTVSFFYIDNLDKIHKIGKIGPINPNLSDSRRFDNDDIVRIDYYCELHPNEIGSVIIFPKPEEQMSNTEQLRFLTKAFDINVPDSLAHLKRRGAE
jgi:plastocyanin